MSTENNGIATGQAGMSKMDKFGPSLVNQDGLLAAEATSLSKHLPKLYYQKLKKTWPEVKSALEKYGLSGTLNKRSIRVSSPTPKTIRKAMQITHLLAIGANPLAARRILNPKEKFAIITIGDKKDGISSKDKGIVDKVQLLKPLVGNSIMNVLGKLTGTCITMSNRGLVVIGESQNIKTVKKVVNDCMLNRRDPLSHVWRLRKINFDERTSNEKRGDAQKTGSISATEMESLCDSLMLLDVSSEQSNMLLTTYGKLQSPLGMQRLKAVESISGLPRVAGSDSGNVVKEFIRLGVVRKILDLFFQYPFNNLLHNQVEKTITSCLESRIDAPDVVHHLLHECDLIGKILEAEEALTISPAESSNKPTVAAEGKSAPRMGNIGHITRISNKIIQLGKNNRKIQEYLQQNREFSDWCMNVLSRRNAVENFYLWTCGHPKFMITK